MSEDRPDEDVRRKPRDPSHEPTIDETSEGLEPTTPTVPSAGAARFPSSIGGYRILRHLGEGGMGVVYEAQQQRPKREVALKVIRGGAFVDEERVKMFEREAQTLARLRHPGIAGIYESGRTEDGQHFFAMELVRGPTLRQFLQGDDGATETAGVDERLRLFLRICDAVNYAHQRGVIHRDLKPSNILVPPEGSETSSPGTGPGVKILDFGLARITDTDVALSTVVSEIGKIKGTLPYMSPEQVKGNPDLIDLRTDVYSLGVILYEMLTGQRPHDVDAGAFHEGARIICEEPPAPLARSWRGNRRPERDLETIVAKALEKDPGRRYQSVASLADDVRRYLEDEPILARPPSAVYQLRKMIARHKIGFAFAVSMVVMLFAFGVAMAVQAGRIARERDRANLEAETARQVSGFLTDLFKVPDPGESKGNTVTAREILDRGAEKIRTELPDRPEVRAGLMETMGEVYSNLGLYDQAAQLIDEVQQIRLDLYPGDHPDVVRVLFLQSQMQQLRGDYAESERLAREALEMQRRVDPQDGVAIANGLQFLAVALKQQDRLDEAEEHYRDALALRIAEHGERDDRTASTLTSLAELLRVKNELDEAETLHRRALEISREVHDGVHPTVLTSLGNLALVLQAKEDPDGAEVILRDSLEATRRLYGDEDPRVARVMNNLAALIRDKDPEEAESLHRQALAMRRKLLGENHPEVASSLNNLAVLLQHQGERVEAEQLMREALAISRALLGDEHPRVGISLYNLGRLLYRKGDYAAAIAPLEEALPLVRRSSPPGHWRPGNLQSMIGHCMSRTGRYEEAEPLLLAGLETIRADRGDEDPRTTTATRRVVELYELWNKPEMAARYRREEGE
jgi:serine/threonine protein kinase/Flp pilus assembly protein TadD